MAYRKSGLFRRGGKTVRETMWIAIDPTDTALAAASNAALIGVLNAAALALRPFTVIRTRGIFHVISDQIAAAENFGAALGFAVVSTQASGIGATAVPLPDVDRGSDLFFVYEEILGRFIFISGAGFENVGNQALHRYDSKAMRKVNDDQDIVTVIQAQSIVSSGQVKHAGRMLIKLH